MTHQPASPVTLDEAYRALNCLYIAVPKEVADDVSAKIKPHLDELKRIKEARDVEPVARLLHRIKPPYEGARAIAARTYDECHENAYPDTWREGDKLYGPEVLDLLAAEKLKLAKVMEALRNPSNETLGAMMDTWNNEFGSPYTRYKAMLNVAVDAALLSELTKDKNSI